MSDYIKGKYDAYVEALIFVLCGYEKDELKHLLKERMEELKNYDGDRD